MQSLVPVYIASNRLASWSDNTQLCIHMQHGACIDREVANQETAVAAKPRLSLCVTDDWLMLQKQRRT